MAGAVLWEAMACVTASPNGANVATSGPRTRAERTNYLETSHYTDVVAFLDSLRGRPGLAFGSIGQTNRGREIPYFSHDPFPRRVASTYAFVGEILSLVAERAGTIRSHVAATDAIPGTWGSDDILTGSIPIRSEMVAAPDSASILAEEVVHTGDSVRTQPGVPPGRRRTGRFTAVRLPVFDRFSATLLAPPPVAYALSASDTAVVRLLRRHGIVVDSLATARATRAEKFIIDSAITASRPFQGHRETMLVGRWMSEPRELNTGTWIVRTRQPLGLLAIYLLEPQATTES